ncbi:MAG: hypothetical protein GX096_09345 [Clostridiales bacterium]|nr:hypothetical protein [Clostridiales bacterium]
MSMGYSGVHWNKIDGNGNAKESFVIFVCRTYHVNYDYLVYGEGSMFNTLSLLDEQILNTSSKLSKCNKEVVLEFAEFIRLNPLEDSSSDKSK